MATRTQGSPRAQSRGIPLDHAAVRQLLPQRYPVLMIDRVEGYHPAERRLVAVKNVSQNDPFLPGHFPDFPIFPGVLVVESLLQAATILIHLDARFRDGAAEDDVHSFVASFDAPICVLAESRVKHMAPSFPGDQVRLEVSLTGAQDGIHTFKVRALTPSGEVASQGRLSVAESAELLTA